MTQNELWWDFFMQTSGYGLTTAVQATTKMIAFEATVLYETFTWSYWAGGYVVTFLDKVDPNINIEIGNMEGAVVDMAVSIVEYNPSGTSYIDLPVDENGDYIFPDDSVSFPVETSDWADCSYIGC